MRALPLVIGAGNAFAGDDAVGRLVAQRLAQTGAAVDIRETHGISADLVALFEGRDQVIIVDACQSGAPVGQVQWIDAARAPLPAGLGLVSSHGMGVAEGVELARSLGLLPARCDIVAIEGGQFGLGAPLSGAVARAIDICVTDIREKLAGPDRVG